MAVMVVLWLRPFVWGTNLTPEPEVLHFGLKVPYISYLWTIFTVRTTQTHFQCPYRRYITGLR